MIEPTSEQWAMLSQALGDLLVELGVIKPAPMTGPELLMHAEILIQDLREGRLRNPLPTVWWCETHDACWVPASDEPADPEDACLYWYWMTDTNETVEDECRMVEMDLVLHETPLTSVTMKDVKPTP